jgi:putative ABC transport system permease protein
MSWVALRMLMGDRTKYLGIIFGIAFATLLMAQQISIFVGIISRTASQVKDVRDADIWVMDANTRFIDEVPPLPESDLQRVRGVPGVAWAVKMYKGQVTCRLESGQFRSTVLFGLDDNSLVGAPQQMVEGKVEDLKLPDAVIVDTAGYEYMWKGEPIRLGRTFELNDHRAVLVGVCKVSPPFFSYPVLYTRYSQAERFVPHDRNLMSYILAKPQPDVSADEVCRRIEELNGDEPHRKLAALTQRQFFWKTIKYFLGSTGIPVNFGITIALGFIVGVAIAGQTFYLFTVENLKQFGALKAMGVNNSRILGMIILQALVVGAIGYGIGAGLTAGFFEGTSHITALAGLGMFPEVMIGVGAAVLFIVLLASVVSARRVLLLEPAVVFRG